jgi:hypothetical protein
LAQAIFRICCLTAGNDLAVRRALESTDVEFINENGLDQAYVYESAQTIK